MLHTISEGAKLIRHSNAVAAGQTDIEPAAGVDVLGYERCLFVVAFGAITTGAITSIKLQQSSTVDGSGDNFSDIAGSAVTVADTDSNELKFLEIVRPTKRYVRCVVDRGTQNAVVDGIFAILNGSRDLPVTQPATTAGKVLVSPDEGTA